jgi:hypothetical protein
VGRSRRLTRGRSIACGRRGAVATYLGCPFVWRGLVVRWRAKGLDPNRTSDCTRSRPIQGKGSMPAGPNSPRDVSGL